MAKDAIEVERSDENHPVDASVKEWEEVLQMLEQKFHCSCWRHLGEAGISLQPLERTMPEQTSALQSLEVLSKKQLGIS